MILRKGIFFITILGVLLSSCQDDNFGEVNTGDSDVSNREGVYIINEGNFNHLSGSLSFFSYDSLTLSDNIFYNANNRPLGDIPHSIAIRDSLGWIPVNNSGKIEVVNLNNGKSLATIAGLTSPRFVFPVDNSRAYVSDIMSDTLSILDLEKNEITGVIPLGRTSECMVSWENKVFVANWSSYYQAGVNNDQLVVIDAVSDRLIDSIRVVKEPNSMVMDANGKLWVLCSGGYTNDVHPALIRINPANHEIEKEFIFDKINSSPEDLNINGNGDTLMYIQQDVYKMAIQTNALPGEPFIKAEERNFRAMAIDPGNSWIFLSDALDYQQKGIVYQYAESGKLIRSFRAGIIPGYFAFHNR